MDKIILEIPDKVIFLFCPFCGKEAVAQNGEDATIYACMECGKTFKMSKER